MPSNYSPANTFHAQVTLPSDGDAATAEAFNLPYRQVADRTTYLKAVQDSHVTAIDALNHVGPNLEVTALMMRADNTGALPANRVNAFAHDPVSGRVVAVGVGGITQVMTPDSGVDLWNYSGAVAGYTGDFYGVIYWNGLWIAFGTSGEIQTAPAGTLSWTRRKTGGASIHSIAASPSMLVAVTADHVWTSPDAITWTDRGAVFGVFGPAAVVYGNGLFIAADLIAGPTTRIQSSVDGINWIIHALPHTVSLSSMIYTGRASREFVAVGGDASTFSDIWVSSDGMTWTRAVHDTSGANLFRAVTAAPYGIYVVGANAGASSPVYYVPYTGTLVAKRVGPPLTPKLLNTVQRCFEYVPLPQWNAGVFLWQADRSPTAGNAGGTTRSQIIAAV